MYFCIHITQLHFLYKNIDSKHWEDIYSFVYDFMILLLNEHISSSDNVSITSSKFLKLSEVFYSTATSISNIFIYSSGLAYSYQYIIKLLIQQYLTNWLPVFQFVSKNILVSYLKHQLSEKVLQVLLFSTSTTKLLHWFFRSEGNINSHKNPLAVILKSYNQPRQLLAKR